MMDEKEFTADKCPMENIKTACIVQGNIRRGTDDVMKSLAGAFDVLILSTWKEDEPKIPEGSFELILNEFPPCNGLTNRNYQRVGVSAGLKLAERLNCNYILKWRTDMLPTKLNVKDLYAKSQVDIPADAPSRIVTCDFRCMSFEPDWFSTIADFFAFGHIDMIKLLWDAEGFDFRLQANPTEEMRKEMGVQWSCEYSKEKTSLFSPEAELYANLKSRLMRKTGQRLEHLMIVRNYLYIINYRKLGICWFAPDQGFRPIGVVYRHPWWTESEWRGGRPFVNSENKKKFWWRKVGRKLEKVVRKRDLLEQQMWWDAYQSKRNPLTKRFSVFLKYHCLNVVSNILMDIWRALQVIERP